VTLKGYINEHLSFMEPYSNVKKLPENKTVLVQLFPKKFTVDSPGNEHGPWRLENFA
jgi:hypothetical protein